MKALLGLAVAIVLVGAGWFLFRGVTPEKTMAPTVGQESASTGSVPSEKKVYTMGEVATHKDATGCLTVIRGTVYDVTAFIDKHPGGDKNILRLCGLDGTASFEKKHGGQEKPENALKGFDVGTLAQ
ncbi:MAG: cytochrome b5 domain-containing protein [Candidatus Moranbacteria bacterium]|nr:cytochrome b5 domain-containing protein [Candidatus Moranbacteria bacterium]